MHPKDEPGRRPRPGGDYVREPANLHPFKNALLDYAISNQQISRYLGISLNYTTNMMNGHVHMPEKHFERLAALVEFLSSNGAKYEGQMGLSP